jgi:branched-chain amino acid transport system substrate-binding protein
MRTGHRSRLLVAGLMLWALVLAGCGGGDGGGGGAQAGGSPGGGGEAVEGAPEKLVIGMPIFLSGGGAPFGVPARGAAEVLVDQWNSEGGIGGAQIELSIIDEAGGDQVTEYRRMVLDEQVDAVVGYVSSGNCLAVAPVAEELEKLTILFDCGTPQIFESTVPDAKYVFRTAGTAVLDGFGAARFVLEHMPDVQTIGGLNQDYAWGRDSWADFELAMKTLKPDIKVVDTLWTELFAGEFSAETTKILSNPPDVLHSSFYGSDLTGLIEQGGPRGLFDKTQVVFTAGEHVLQEVGDAMPERVFIGARGTGTWLNPEQEDNPLQQQFVEAYREKTGNFPIYSAYHMSQALYGLKAAYEKAIEDKGSWPSQEEVATALEDLEYEAPSGTVKMDGHQALMPSLYGTAAPSDEFDFMTLTDVVIFEPEKVQPPAGVSASEWVESESLEK